MVSPCFSTPPLAVLLFPGPRSPPLPPPRPQPLPQPVLNPLLKPLRRRRCVSSASPPALASLGRRASPSMPTTTPECRLLAVGFASSPSRAQLHHQLANSSPAKVIPRHQQNPRASTSSRRFTSSTSPGNPALHHEELRTTELSRLPLLALAAQPPRHFPARSSRFITQARRLRHAPIQHAGLPSPTPSPSSTHPNGHHHRRSPASR